MQLMVESKHKMLMKMKIILDLTFNTLHMTKCCIINCKLVRFKMHVNLKCSGDSQEQDKVHSHPRAICLRFYLNLKIPLSGDEKLSNALLGYYVPCITHYHMTLENMYAYK